MRGHVRRFFGMHLHRRIFLWFGASILITALVSWVVVAIVSPGGPGWHEQVERVRTFVGHRFEAVWDDESARDELGRDIAADLGVGIELLDARGATIARYGPSCEGHRDYDAPVRRSGRTIGTVVACSAERRHFGLGGILGLLAALVTLWLLSGFVAHRLSRPLRELVRVTRELGEGKLQSRVRLGRHHAGEVGVLACSVNDMAMRIEKQIADQRELLAAVSHEIRTPLGHLRILLEMAREQGASDKTLDEMERELCDADGLVGELLASSRLEFAAIDRLPLDGADVARRGLERAGLPEERLTVEGDVALEGDPNLLGRALANLIVNAEKHGGGLVALTVGRSDGRVAFEVKDGGPGFAEGETSKVFESFYRGGRSRASLGLGLALVRRIAVAHGGKAWAANDPAGGARVGFDVAVKNASA